MDDSASFKAMFMQGVADSYVDPRPSSIAWDKWLAREKAEAVREFARSINLDAIAEEWSGDGYATNIYEREYMHWAADQLAPKEEQ